MVFSSKISDCNIILSSFCLKVGVHLPEEQGPAHLFLAQYYMKMGSFKEAEAHAHKCTNFVKASATLYTQC